MNRKQKSMFLTDFLAAIPSVFQKSKLASRIEHVGTMLPSQDRGHFLEELQSIAAVWDAGLVEEKNALTQMVMVFDDAEHRVFGGEKAQRAEQEQIQDQNAIAHLDSLIDAS